jgi:hypothetical protein
VRKLLWFFGSGSPAEAQDTAACAEIVTVDFQQLKRPYCARSLSPNSVNRAEGKTFLSLVLRVAPSYVAQLFGSAAISVHLDSEAVR